MLLFNQASLEAPLEAQSKRHFRFSASSHWKKL